MVRLKSIGKISVLVLILSIAGTETVSAFHDGGAGACEACHEMHSPSASPAAFLLKGSDPSSICLNCHEGRRDVGPTGYHVSTSGSELTPGIPPKQLSPGGDFGWLKKDFSWQPDATSAMEYSFGERHGHNVVALDYLFAPDATNTAAPGGVYPSINLSCISCHDPHGRYRRTSDGSVTTSTVSIAASGSYENSPNPGAGESVGVYRMLGGQGYEPKSFSVPQPFTNDPPAAVAPANYNRSESAVQTRVAYGSGMSEWCRNCHPDMHNEGSAGFGHPAAEGLGSTQIDSYNSYIKTGDLTGTQLSSFLSLVPFEEGITNYAVLKTHARSDGSYLEGPAPSSNAQVMCLTCHRAHASGWDGIMRWNARTDYIVFNGAYSEAGQPFQPYGQGRTDLEASRAYYDLPASMFAPNQESLCFKCHAGGIP